jgi:hypothetical protein
MMCLQGRHGRRVRPVTPDCAHSRCETLDERGEVEPCAHKEQSVREGANFFDERIRRVRQRIVGTHGDGSA